jgi:PAS domain S-box
MQRKEQLVQNVVYSISRIVSTEREERAIAMILETMCHELGFKTSAFWLVDEKAQKLFCEDFYSSQSRPDFQKCTRQLRLSRGEGLPGRVWESNEAAWIPDVVKDSNFPRAYEAGRDGLHSALAFPVSVAGEFLGVFEFFSTDIAAPDEDLLAALNIAGAELGGLFKRRRTELALEEQAKRFSIFADNVNECLFVSSPLLQQHYYVSPAFEKIFGHPVSAVFENPNIWSEGIIPEHKERVMEYVSRLKGYEMPEPYIEYQINRDGRLRWLGVKIFAAVDQQDGSYQICGSVSDITEKKAAEMRVSEFYSMVSHELRTPLTSMKGVLLLLERGKAGKLSEQAEQLILLGRKECDRLIRLINDMLDIKKIEVGKLQLYRQNLDPGDVVRQTIETLTSFAAEKKIRLKEDIRTDESIYADKDRVVQIITNLISNSVKFSSNGSDVIVKVERADERVRFSVTDSGPGINAADQDKLFKVFEHIDQDESTGKEGTGLGLAICKGIVDEHGGRIGVMSTEGRGATFWFELPLGAPELISRESPTVEA